MSKEDIGMPENVSIRCEGNFIKVNWEWGSSDFISMKIFYKKKEIENGDGTEFTLGGVLYYPGRQNGNAEKRLTNESGLYTFTLLPVGKNGISGQKTVVTDIMLGEQKEVNWHIVYQKDRVLIVFPKLEFTIPSSVVFIKYDNYMAPLNYKINSDSKLFFPFGIDTGHIALIAKKPYDKVYRFIQI